ncbi:DNA-directed DNA polymerase, partial [Tanacetum coccineum]
MPKYAKFIKGLLTNKARLEEACMITMNERCSAMLLNKLPSKENDPGSFTIPCDIGQLHINNALADLGASICLMPYTMYEKLGLGEPKATRMSLEVADRSIQYPRGIIENVLIKVDKFVLPIDFVILDMPEDSRVPIILGRSFLSTARAMIDVFNKKITLRVGDDEIIFDVDQSIKRPPAKDDECYGGLEKLIDQSDLESCESFECKAIDNPDSGEPIQPSANDIDAKKTKLKILLHHLEYAYLHRDKSFPIIIASELSEKEKMLLLQVLEKRNGAFAWKMSDIKGISLSYCIHKIIMEDDYKPVIQPQRRLNPKVQDVVKNKIVKLLDSGLIYPISNSSWVSPIHVVPKKGGMTVVLNDNNELIPSRTRLCGNEYYCFLDGFSGFFQIPIAPEDQEKTLFTCPYGTFPYRRMPFGLCNALSTFQRCMTAIFHDMVEDFMEVFIDGFSLFGNSFDCCLADLDRMLARCEETNLVLNWEKCHFMVKEGIVLGHKSFGAGIKYLFNKEDAKLRLIGWVLLLQGFDIEIKDKKGAENFVADHFSRLENPDLGAFTEEEIADKFLDEYLMILKTELNDDEPWYADYVNYIVGKIVPLNWTPEKRRRFFSQVKNYFWDEPYPFKLCPDNVIRRCVAGNDTLEILAHCHSGPNRGHHSASITGRKVYESGFFWPSIFKDAKDYLMRCDACQRSRNISSRSEIPQNNIQ